MITFYNTYFPLLKFIISYSLIYVVVPLLLVRRLFKNYTFSDKIIFSFSCSNLFFILTTHILSILKIYEVFSIYLVSAATFTFIYKYKSSKIPETRKPTYFIFKSIEDKFIPFNYINKIYNKTVLIIKDIHAFVINKRLLTTSSNYLTLSIFLISFYVNFKHSLSHLYLSSDDSYVHLTWSKYLSFNNIYKEGIYPYGFESVISSVSKLFSIYPYYIVRYIGPLTAVLTLFSIYLFVYSLTNKYKNLSAFYAIFFYTIFSNPLSTEYGIPVNWWRNISGLSMEYSIIFILPGVYSLICFLKTQKTLYLYIYYITMILTLLIHPYSFIILVSISIILYTLNFKSFLKNFKKLFTLSLLSTSIGIFPILIGFLSGKNFYTSSIDYVSDFSRLKFSFSFNKLKNILNQSTLTNTALILSLFVIVSIFLIFLIRKKILKKYTNFIILFNLSFILIFLNILYKLKNLGLPNLIDSFRITPYLSLFIVTFFALIINILISKINTPGFYILINSITIFFLVISSLLFTDSSIVGKNTLLKFPVVSSKKEYDDAVYVNLKIKKNYQYKDWIIVAPTEQFQHSLGYGFHKEIWQFAQDYSKNITNYNIKNKYVFIFIEKKPLYSNTKINNFDYTKSFPIIEDNLSKYYTKKNNRRIIEAQMYKWQMEFQNKNKSLEVYFDSEYLTVYKLVQDPYNPINLF